MATAEVVVEEVAGNLEEAAVAVRKLDAKSLGFGFGGLCVGIGIGILIGYRISKEKLRAEIYAQAEEEVDQIRQMYQESVRIVPEPKPKPEKIVEQQGYSELNVTPEKLERPLPPPVPAYEPPPAPSIIEHTPEPPNFRTVRTEEAEKDKNEGWSYPYELSTRRANVPFIIHQDEYFGNETEYGQTTYTYYAGDDILTDTDETVLHNRENLIGPDALRRFGHGSDDYNVVYVRNPHLELEIEICRLPGSYEVDVQGLEHESATDNTEPD